MFKTYSNILLFIVLIGLVGCSNVNQTTNKDTEKEANDEQDTDVAAVPDNTDRESSESGAAEDDTVYNQKRENLEKLQRIMEGTVKKIHKMMTKEQDTHDWFMLEDEDPDEFADELKRIKYSLSAFITDDYLDKQARELLEVYTCYCDSYFVFDEKDTLAGFELTELTNDTFKAETITLDDGFYGVGWTNEWSFKKEDGAWKLDNFDYTFADDEPLQLTYKDIEHSYYNEETGKLEAINFVEYINVDDVQHLVIQRKSGDIEIYNTETGVMNFTAMEEYARSK